MISPLHSILAACALLPLQQEEAHAPSEAPVTAEHKHTNALINETSPYLLQHAHNPVNWHPWGPEAIAKAKEQNKPIFLSIGYSACHWCHVMERESFENEAIAAVMNEHFINIKVDREERPDIDEIYMKAVQTLTGSGGWPMSVWLTPELEPFFGGTYFPPRDAYGRRGFPSLCQALADAWTNDRAKIVEQAGKLTEHISREGSARSVGDVAPDILERAFAALQQSYDPIWGGFGGAPKFLHTGELRVLLRHWLASGEDEALTMVMHTLDKMAAGGMYDQLGGGFHRYSVDEQWLIPHFEKMLYDNSLMIPTYLEAYLAMGGASGRRPEYARIARECCEWVLREMVTPEGGFASTQDADSEGEEGKFFAWTGDELIEVLGPKHGVWAAEWWGVTAEGNFEHGKSALWHKDTPQQVADRLNVDLAELTATMGDARIKLFAERAKRIAPGTDDKVLASWNGLMITAMAKAYQVLDDPRYLDAARAAARYVLEGMRQEDGRLFATARHGRAHLNAYLDDYAFMTQGLIDLYESDFDPKWLHEALALNAIVLERFADEKHGGFFTTGNNHEKLIARLKAPQDGAIPSGNGVHALNLLRLAELTGDGTLAKHAESTIRSTGNALNNYPAGFGQMLMAVDFVAQQPREIVIAGEPSHPAVRAMLAEVRGRFYPQRVVALATAKADSDLIPLLEGRTPSESGARAYVCQNYTCQLPVDTVEALAEQLDE